MVCGGTSVPVPFGSVSTLTLFAGPVVKVKALLVPVSVPDVRVEVIVKFPVFENVTLCEPNTPFVKAAVVPPPAESVPVDVIPTVPAKPGTVFPNVSRAVTLIANETPAACVGIFPPADDSTRKLSSGPGVTESVPEFVAVSTPEVAWIAADPTICPMKTAHLRYGARKESAARH